jgi:putative FmdB family regulatory protein
MTMPTYVYQCDKCGVQFERRQRITDDPLTQCPECEGQVHRVFQPVGIVFKGSGWYCTDHRAKSPTALPGESKGAGSGPKDETAKAAPAVKAESPTKTEAPAKAAPAKTGDE